MVILSATTVSYKASPSTRLSQLQPNVRRDTFKAPVVTFRETFRVNLEQDAVDGRLLESLKEERPLGKADRARLMDVIYEQYLQKHRSR